jgi:hypothetical protein
MSVQSEPAEQALQLPAWQTEPPDPQGMPSVRSVVFLHWPLPPVQSNSPV